MSVEQDQLKTDYKRVFSGAEGKSVLSDLARFSNAMVPVSPSRPDLPALISYVEGMRGMFWHIFGMVYDESPESVEERSLRGAPSSIDPQVLDAFSNMRNNR